MRRTLIFPCALLLLCLLCFTTARAESAKRALLIGSDTFLSQPSTAPSSKNNVERMALALNGGDVRFDRITTHSDEIATLEAFDAAVSEAFADAQAGDVSYFYISTHGLWERGQSAEEMTLLLSDGTTESGLTAAHLKEVLDRVAGTKVLIIDACRSGAILGKGVNDAIGNVFAGSDYKVLCSSGGMEESWFWSSPNGKIVGAGYFSEALMGGVSQGGGYAADTNDDGVVTLGELARFLRENHGASTVQVYPTDSDFPVFTYDTSLSAAVRGTSTLRGITFGQSALDRIGDLFEVSFTVLRPVRLAYRVVYFGDDGWQFESSSPMFDNSERYGVYGDAAGWLSPGYKQRSLTLAEDAAGNSGYAMLQMITLTDGTPHVEASHVLCVPPTTGDPLLEVKTTARFVPQKGEEAEIVVHHQFPCVLTVTVEDMQGNRVARLASGQASRPQQLRPLGSTFSWNGLTKDGTLAGEGEYRIRVSTAIGGVNYEEVSVPFLLLSPQG